MADQKKSAIRLVVAVCAAVVISLLIGAWALSEFVRPTNAADNANPTKQAEMLRITLHAADLHPIPPGATGLSIKTEGNAFTRSFRVEFSAPPAAVKKWLDSSKGISRARVGKSGPATKYVVNKPNDGYERAEVIVDPAGRVKIYVEWS